jgi:hypothetical protein
LLEKVGLVWLLSSAAWVSNDLLDDKGLHADHVCANAAPLSSAAVVVARSALHLLESNISADALHLTLTVGRGK